MKFNILTLFPEIFPGPLNHSLTGKALKNKLFKINTINIRDFSTTKSKTVDDKPFGGGAGMIIKPDVLQSSLNHAKKITKGSKEKILYFSPSGKKINQKLVNDLINFKEIILICGKYEGVDQRFIDYNKIEEISLGDYIISGGELAAFILIDACVRLIPEVLGNNNSLNVESFNDNLLEYSQYTKPYEWKNIKVPEILLSGNHKKISDWRLKNSLEKTKKIRPDLYELYLKENKRKL
jgi:tRNA (guanine37-N1)-methyltransferase|tara:strand:- start:268 stop:978 length:711 start_codon:yes stop_codon:yes gene_type:complete